jgi:hypothetical protein
MITLRLTLVTAVMTAALPATASAALTKVADPINVAPDASVALGQYYPDVAMASDGSFAVSYVEQDDPVDQVWVQRFAAGFAKVGDRIRVGLATQRNTQSSIAMAPDGRFAVAFQTFPPAGTPSQLIEVQRFAANGTPVGAPLVPDSVNRDNDGEPPALAMADDGGLAVAWIAYPATMSLQTYDAAGAPRTAVQPLDANAQSNARPSIGMAGDGRFVVTAAASPAVGTAGSVPSWRFHADGTPHGTKTALYTGEINTPYGEPTIALGDDGRSFLAFDGPHDAGSFESDVWGRRFDGAGTALGDRFGVSEFTAYSQRGADVEVTDDGGALVAFEGQNGTEQWGYLRRFGAGGTPDGIEEHVSTSASGGLQAVRVDTDGRARAAIAYADSFSGSFREVMVGRWNFAPATDLPPVVDPGPTPGPAPAPAETPAAAAPVPAPIASGADSPKIVAAAGTPKVSDVVTFPTARSCASRRRFGIRLRVPKGSSVTQATVKVNGRTVAVRKGARLRSTVDLRNLPKGRFTVAVELKLADGKTVKGTRAYRTCTAKRRGGKPKV